MLPILRKSLAILALAAALSSPLSGGEEKCGSTAKGCELQIREMLKGRNYLGIRFEQARFGIMIREVVPGSPAARAGFREDDLILALNGRDMSRADARRFKQFLQEARAKHEGRMNVLVSRYGQVRRIHATLGEMPKDQIDKIVLAHMKEAHGETATGN